MTRKDIARELTRIARMLTASDDVFDTVYSILDKAGGNIEGYAPVRGAQKCLAARFDSRQETDAVEDELRRVSEEEGVDLPTVLRNLFNFDCSG